jgi:hypothetical protein
MHNHLDKIIQPSTLNRRPFRLRASPSAWPKAVYATSRYGVRPGPRSNAGGHGSVVSHLGSSVKPYTT